MPYYIHNYPRPQFVREQWQSLNGTWQFAFDDADEGIQKGYPRQLPQGMTIQVPFSYETAMSGIGDTQVHPVVWYQRTVELPEPAQERLLLHLEGSDYHTQVWADGQLLGAHQGGYSRFTFDLTEAARGKRTLTLTVRVADSLAQDQPRGKQRYRRESWGCWYVQTTGIWKTVWLERVPREYLLAVKNTPDAEKKTLELFVQTRIPEQAFDTAQYALETEISFAGTRISRQTHPLTQAAQNITVPICPDGETLRLWSPEEPNLYDITYRLCRDGTVLDTVHSYFGVRRITIQGNRILLNGKALYLRMILDQGYWKDSGLTPPDEEALRRDIALTVQYGYNGVRKHQKVEDERYLYWCDVQGLLVWSEMAACYEYNDRAVARFTEEWSRIVRQNQNHPCIITWVPFNESWGIPGVKDDPAQQAFVNGIYYLTKALDGTRPVVTNDGWEHTLSDILTIHDYKEYGKELLDTYLDEEQAVLHNQKSFSWYGQLAFAQGYHYRGQPVLLSEYGGISFSGGDGWGYGEKVTEKAEFFRRFQSQNEAIAQIPTFTGFCYTQLTDVQQETNGWVDMARAPKFTPEEIQRIRRINESTGKA